MAKAATAEAIPAENPVVEDPADEAIAQVTPLQSLFDEPDADEPEAPEAPPAEEPPAEATPAPVEEPPVEVVPPAPPDTPDEEQIAQHGTQQHPKWEWLREARKKEKQLAEQNEALQQELARLRQAAPTAQPQAAQAAAVDAGTAGVDRPYTQQELVKLRDDDPIEYSRVVAELAYQHAAQSQQQQQIMQFHNQVRNQIDSYKAQVPDYDQAAQFLEDRELTAMRTIGIPAAAQLGAHQPSPDGYCCQEHGLMTRTGLLMRTAVQQNKSIPQLAYEVAQAYGYQPPAAQPEVAQAPAAQTPAARVAASAARGAVAATSLTGMPGALGSKPQITRDEFMEADESKIAAWEKEYGTTDLEKFIAP